MQTTIVIALNSQTRFDIREEHPGTTFLRIANGAVSVHLDAPTRSIWKELAEVASRLADTIPAGVE